MEPIGLYVHIPFCASKCGYCDFYSETNPEGQAAYLAALLDEIRSWRGKGVQADTLFVGGGTPSVMEPYALLKILDTCREVFSLSGECTLEANPDSVSPEFLRAVRQGGFNRISFGAQSAIDGELRALGRRHDAERIGTAVRWAKEAGFLNLSLDVMLWIPGFRQDGFRGAADTFFRGIHNNRSFFSTIFNYAAPIVGIMILVNVVASGTNVTYALQITNDGDLVGYVEDESVFTNAQEELRQRIVRTDGSADTFKIKPSISLLLKRWKTSSFPTSRRRLLTPSLRVTARL